MGLTKVYLQGVTTRAQAVAPTLPLGIAKGNATMNSAVPNTVAARPTGLTISASMVIDIPSSYPKAGAEEIISITAISMATAIFFMELPP
jgi:hypothetical protein